MFKLINKMFLLGCLIVGFWSLGFAFQPLKFDQVKVANQNDCDIDSHCIKLNVPDCCGGSNLICVGRSYDKRNRIERCAFIDFYCGYKKNTAEEISCTCNDLKYCETKITSDENIKQDNVMIVNKGTTNNLQKFIIQNQKILIVMITSVIISVLGYGCFKYLNGNSQQQ